MRYTQILWDGQDEYGGKMEKQQSGRSSQPVNGFLILHPRENANSKKIRGSASFVLALRSNAKITEGD